MVGPHNSMEDRLTTFTDGRLTYQLPSHSDHDADEEEAENKDDED